MSTSPSNQPERRARLGDLSEEEVLRIILPLMAVPDERVLVGPGDDAAVMSAGDGRFVTSTDASMRNIDWRDDWSSGDEVGRKIVAQNLADVAAMGAVPAGLLVTLLAGADTEIAWVEDLARGIGESCLEAGCPVLGGDLGGAPAGVVVLSVTSFGDLQGRAPVLRSGAQRGDVVAVAGSLGRSGAGLALLHNAPSDLSAKKAAQELIDLHRVPRPPLAAGPRAAEAGAHALIDISDGLIRDAGRVASASGVRVSLFSEQLAADVDAISAVWGRTKALEMVLTGGEEHALLAFFPPNISLPDGFRRIGEVTVGTGVTVDGERRQGGGWDHFGG
ncbi:thiamine-phosphate kinase [Austwickia chelonae]|uniref:Thiamine-monophosphate kinase n=1 Tax=Austwickia chelonae NBRC 105200 TaxID=1184607 RepID=K6VIP1_9MICO|nr:thiamine-phosphate kinase [Austwickia chelonae]GAB76594.1 thiamine monophosphate kinase [Austwickia chelonae NBRC 105200]SEW27607.1 thiamine-phosphate kinase [Austwickia chelonae]